MDCILGVDGKRTKTLARITDLKGEILFENNEGFRSFKSVNK